MVVLGFGVATPALAHVKHPEPPLDATTLGVVVNDADPLSVRVGRYYQHVRAIPARNMVHVRIASKDTKMSATDFASLKSQIDSQLDARVEAIVMIWTTPYAVECNSITAAYTMGLDIELCKNSCAPSRASPYYDSASSRPYSYRHLRLAMLLPTESFAAAKALIDRGVKSDGTMPQSSGYFLTTSDAARNTRTPFFPPSQHLLWPPLNLVNLQADSIADKADVLFYFTGALRVPKLDTLKFVPGAIADHLTSTGGDLRSNAQMSSLEWLAAGATASYGTVSEPCNYWQKFPNPVVLLKHYLGGEPDVVKVVVA